MDMDAFKTIDTQMEKGEHIIFSDRLYLTTKAELWCKQRGVPINRFNTITALSAMGYINKDRVKQDSQEDKKSILDTLKPGG